MKHLTILPADSYIVINKTTITDSDRKIISMLYQPIIGYTAVSLYYTLIDDLDKLQLMSEELTHHHLMATMQLKLDDIIIAREKLEGVGLIKTYVKKGNINSFVYLLYSPITANEFFNHPVLNVVLYNNLGKKEYEKILNYYKVPRINLKDYEEITCSFDDAFTSISGNILEMPDDVIKRDSNNLQITKGIDFNMLISSIPSSTINERCFNKETKELINALSFTYNLSTLDMQGLVKNSINEKGMVDKTELRKNCRDYYKFDNNGKLPTLIYNKQPDYLKKPNGDNSKWAKMVYTFESLNPYQFLKAKYKNGEPTERDLRLIESLLVDQKLNSGVVNVLIAYVLKINNEKLSKSYVETIAGQWKRLNIETVEEAMRITEKEHKKMKKMFEDKKKPQTTTIKKQSLPEKEVPAWFNQNPENKTLTATEQQEMDQTLEEMNKVLSELI